MSLHTTLPPAADWLVPPAARWLGFAGLIPFVAGALATLPVSGALRPYGLPLLLDYGAIILSFMGGVHWGAAMMRDDAETGPLARSVAPALIGLPAALVGGAGRPSAACGGLSGAPDL
jgi:hypothetical protein